MSSMEPAQAAKRIARWLDAQGRLAQWPVKQSIQGVATAYLVAKFEVGRRYSEAEVNAVLDSWHLFNDPACLRRAMVEWERMDRTSDGSAYWLTQPNPE